mgnify:CR=1 FL=1|jgi:hypothetical protein
MTITINEAVCRDYGLTLAEVLAILLVKTGTTIPELYMSLEEKKALIKDGIFPKYLITQGYDERVSSILLDSDKSRQPPERIDNLATKMMELFPAAKKTGTSQYYRGNRKDITLRLKKFFKLYGNKFTDKQILEATEKYVKSFNGDYRYMRVLKYFIWKDERRVDSDGVGYIDEVSDLATYIENETGRVLDNDWTANLK